MAILVKDLPYPPTQNSYYGRTKTCRVYVTAIGKAYQKEVFYLLNKEKQFEDKVFLKIYLSPPDRRIRDFDNVFKSLLDSIKYSGVIKDDSFIRRCYIDFLPVVKGGKVRIELEDLKEFHPKIDGFDYDNTVKNER